MATITTQYPTIRITQSDCQLVIKEVAQTTVIQSWSWTVNIENFISSAWFTEEPAGAINSINTNYSLTHTPNAWSEKLYLNWQRLKRILDYTISSNIITMTSPPIPWDLLVIDYIY